MRDDTTHGSGAAADRAVVERRLEIPDRYVWDTIHDMILRDPLKAIVELVTNSDDSYARLEARDLAVTGRIEIEVEEHRGGRPSILRVRDDAEGFDVEGMDTRVGRMGKATSGLLEGAPVRGVWGDGMKEASLGLGVAATVTSIRDGRLVQARLAWSADREPIYAREEPPREVTAEDRAHLDLAGDGTVVEVEVAPGIAVPRHDRLVRDVGLHVALRDIVSSPTRRVVVRRLGRVAREDRAVYREPLREPGLQIHEQATVPGYPDAEVELWMWPALEPLSGAEDGSYRTGGLLVQSRRALVECSFFGHEGCRGTERLWGRVRCDAIHARLAAGEPVLARDRTGLARENPFVRALVRTIDAMVEPYVLAEEHLAEVIDLESATRSKRRFGALVHELNRICARELPEASERSAGQLDSTPRRVATSDQPPPSELSFDRLHQRIRVGRWMSTRITARAGATPRRVDVTAEGDIEVRPAQVVLDGDGARMHAQLAVRGLQIGAAGLLVATAGDHRARCAVDIVGRREDTSVAHGPIGEILLDASPAPERRVMVREGDGTIVVYVNNPSIAGYLSDPVDRDAPSGRAVLAELVLEAFCTHLALRKVDEGDPRDPARALLAHIDRLQHAHGALVHRILARR